MGLAEFAKVPLLFDGHRQEKYQFWYYRHLLLGCRKMQSYAQNCATLKPVTSQPCVEIDKPDRRCLGKLWLVRCSYRFDMYRKAECHCTCEKLVQHSRRLPQVQLLSHRHHVLQDALPVVASLVISWPWPGCISCSSQEAGRLGAPTGMTAFYFLHFSTSWKKSWDLEWCEKGLLGWTANASWSFFEELLVTISIRIFI